ncbi:hypothetical protein [Nostoc sp. TCL240-02]|uniref:hypothetical protein n=1 Tax=Nostoc sp. TCL240-02 TaxID=2572090 RepID=UPI00157F866A|nr:hypothetical protein [Nostoc sp. TCL240-02]QKQ75563.1 hypothetical protein FBB35_21765 [Nostoc sp. TCL240-02]
MPTYVASSSPSSLLHRNNTLQKLEGNEGKKLNDKINDVAKKIEKDAPIQRLLKEFDEASEQRHQGLRTYLDSLRLRANSTGIDGFTISVLDTAWQTWEKLKEYFSSKGLSLEVPDACPGESDNFMYTWSKGEHYLECEIFGNKEIEFFYQNRNTSEVWGEDTTLEQEFSAAVLEKAALFAW